MLRDTLVELSVPAFYLPEGEADGYCYSLANELGGWVLSADSDFAIFGGGASSRHDGEGYQGWIHIDLIQWMLEPLQRDEEAALSEMEGFSLVKSKTSRAQATATMFPSLVPPKPLQGSSTIIYPSLFLEVCHPDQLASRLRIPPKHLPLLASIAGTDDSPPSAAHLFFEARSNGINRIEKVGRVIREALTPAGQSKLKQRSRLAAMASQKLSKSDDNIDSGMSTPQQSQTTNGAVAGDEAYEFVSYIVAGMMSTWNPGPRAPATRLKPEVLQELVSDIIDATCQYIPPGSPADIEDDACCDTFPYCRCNRHDDMRTDARRRELAFNDLRETRRAYAMTRARGYMSSFSYYLNPSATLVFGILEDPEGVSLRATNISRGLRRIGWRIFLQGVGGLPRTHTNGGNNEVSMPHTATQSHHILGEDRMEDTTARETASMDEEVLSLNTVIRDSQAVDVVELLRAGSSTRIKDVPLEINEDNYSIGDLGIFDHQDVNKRVDTFFNIMQSSTPKVLGLQPEWRLWAAMLRMAARLAYEHKSPWSRKELRLAVLAGVLSMAAWSHRQSVKSDTEMQSPLLETRNCNIQSHVVAIALDASQLAQALLLDSEDSSPFRALYRFLEGTVWHQVLLGQKKEDPELTAVVTACFEAAVEGSEAFLSHGTARASGDSSWSSKTGPRRVKNGKVASSSTRGKSRFDLLREA